jgi:hypothetical protein
MLSQHGSSKEMWQKAMVGFGSCGGQEMGFDGQME